MGLLSITDDIAMKLDDVLAGTSTATKVGAGGAAGLTGGMYVDDVPILGPTLDWTEDSGSTQDGPLSGVSPNLLLIAIIALGFAYVMSGR